MKLDIGGGVYPREGYLNVDAYTDNADIHAEMWAIPLEDGSVSEIWACHSLEHVTKFDVVPTLKEWKRLLIPGGFATVQVPDLEWCLKNWLWRRSNDWHLDVIFGQQTSPGEAHRTGFTYEIMQSYIEQAGLQLESFEVVQSHGQPTLSFVIRKVV